MDCRRRDRRASSGLAGASPASPWLRCCDVCMGRSSLVALVCGLRLGSQIRVADDLGCMWGGSSLEDFDQSGLARDRRTNHKVHACVAVCCGGVGHPS